MREYCKKNDLIIIKEYSIVESSTKGERPEFNKCLQFIREQKTKVALVSDKVDRLQRSILDVPKIDQLVNASESPRVSRPVVSH
jgi:DNA invertase Pin-like site-specific DNA recombinase